MKATSHGGLLIAILALLSIFPPLATDMYLAALGHLARDLNTSASAAEMSLSIFFLGLGVGQLIMGPLIDGYGRKIPLLFGTLLFIFSSIALIFVQDIVLFNGLRFLQAIGACAGMVISRAIVADLYEGQEAAKKMTVLVMLMTVGPIISPTIGSLLYEGFGWRSIFVVMVIVGLTALILSKLYISETLAREKRTKSPFKVVIENAKILLFQNNYIVPVIVGAFVQSAMFAFITGSSGVFQGIFKLDALHYGFAFAAIAVALFVFGSINKKLLDHYKPVQILTAALPIYVCVAIVLNLVAGTENLWIYCIPLWFNIGFVSLVSASAIALAMGAARERAGAGSALLGVLQFSIAFLVSTAVAIGGTDTTLPMSLGILIPAILACGLWFWKKPQD